MSLIAERVFPYLIAIACAVWWYVLDVQLPVGNDVITAMIALSGVLVGFLATGMAILLSISSPIMRDLAESGYKKDLVSYFEQAIWFNLLFCFVNACGFFSIRGHDGFGVIWVALGSAASLCFVRVVHIMLKVFRYADPR
jgi:hypothetical protein